MAKTTELKDLLAQVRQATEKLKAKIYELDEQIKNLQETRDAITHGPLSKEDYMAVVRADIQAKGRLFATNLTLHLSAGGQVNYTAALQKEDGNLPIRYLDAGAGFGAEMPEGAFYFYFEDAIVAGVERALVGKEWPVEAVPFKGREATLKALSGRMDALLQEREALAGEFASHGLKE